MKQTFTVTGMTCSACSAHVEKAVGKLTGVSAVNVNLLSGSMQVTYDEKALSPEEIIRSVTAAGYGASLPGGGGKKQEAHRDDAMAEEIRQMKHRLIWSFVFLIPLFYIAMGHMLGAPLPDFLMGRENAVTFALTQLLLPLPIPSGTSTTSTTRWGSRPSSWGPPTWTPLSLWAPPPPWSTGSSPSSA